MKFKAKAIAAVLTAAALCAAFTSCSQDPRPDKKYLTNVEQMSFWSNSAKNSVAQYNVYNHVNDFLSDGKIVDGNVVSNDGKVKKVLFLGFDGMIADALANIFLDENAFETNGYNTTAQYSGINEVKKEGGLYLAYCGGEKGKSSEQSTSTSASWTSEFTGVWGEKHGIKENDDIKNMEYKTFMLQYAEKGLQTSIAFEWDQYLDLNLRNEVKYVMENPQIQMHFCDIDREKATSLKEDALAENLELYNYVAPEKPYKDAEYDVGLRDYVFERIEKGDDIVCGIFHSIDSNGHNFNFSNSTGQYVNSVRNCDTYAYQIVEKIKEREAKYNEDWLIVFANDHG